MCAPAPLLGKRILLTRDPHGPLAKQLTELGALVTVVPTIELVDPPQWQDFDAAAASQTDFAWALFTSKEAVIRCSKRLQTLGLTLAPHLKLAAVGSQTAHCLSEHFWPPDLVPAEFQAEGLMAAWAEEPLTGKGIWFPRALEARDNLTQFLLHQGARLCLTPVYQNRLPAQAGPALQAALDQGQDWVCFTSSSTVENFFTLCPQLPQPLPQAAAIGKVTAQALATHGWPVAALALPQTLAGLAQAIVKAENAN